MFTNGLTIWTFILGYKQLTCFLTILNNLDLYFNFFYYIYIKVEIFLLSRISLLTIIFMVKKKKKFINYLTKISTIQQKVISNHSSLWHISSSATFSPVHTSSFFDFSKYTSKHFSNINFSFDPVSNSEIPKYKSLIVDVFPTSSQKHLLFNWFDANIHMYNFVISYFKSSKVPTNLHILKKLNLQYYNLLNLHKGNNKILKNQKNIQQKLIKKLTLFYKKTKSKKNALEINKLQKSLYDLKLTIKNLNINNDKQFKSHCKLKKEINKLNKKINSTINFYNVRKSLLKTKKDIIFKSGKLGNSICTHVLDSIIHLAISNMSSIKSNFLNGNIKTFRLKYWRHSKKNKILIVEKEYITNGHIFEKILGKMKYMYNKKPYILDKNSSLKLIYYKDTNQYKLYVSEKIEQQQVEPKNVTEKFICIDQNISPFIVGRTNNEIIKIGINLSKRVKNYIKRIDKINEAKNLTEKIRRLKESRYYKKIKNIVDEIHWKTIKNITNNYKYVVIGDVSLKEATKKGSSVLNKLTKRVGLMERLSEFRNRLKYKYLVNGIKYKMVDEWGTSKTCSNCGEYKRDLKGEKIIKCINCKPQDRDVNSATCITLINME